MYFCVNEFEVGINHSIFSGIEQQKVYFREEILIINHYSPKAKVEEIIQ